MNRDSDMENILIASLSISDVYSFSHTRTNLVYSANSDILLTFCSQNKSFFLNNGFSVIDNGAENTNKMQIQHQQVTTSTGGPSSSCEMIILRNNSHGGIIRVCMGIFTTALRYKIIRQILKKNTSPYFHSVSLVI